MARAHRARAWLSQRLPPLDHQQRAVSSSHDPQRQDVASLYLQVLELGGRSGYMKYRTVPVYRRSREDQKAIERIATKQQPAPRCARRKQRPGPADRRRPIDEVGCAGPSAAPAHGRRSRISRTAAARVLPIGAHYRRAVGARVRAAEAALLHVVRGAVRSRCSRHHPVPALYLLATSFTPLDLTGPRRSGLRDAVAELSPAAVGRRLHNSVWVQVKLRSGRSGCSSRSASGLALLLNLRSRYLEALRRIFLIPWCLRRSSLRSSEDHLHAGHQPDALDLRPAGWNVRADHPSRSRADGDHHRGDLGVVPVHHADDLAALQMMPDERDGSAKIDGAHAVGRPQIYVTLPSSGAVLLVGAVPPDRQYQGVPADLHPDRGGPGNGHGGDELLFLPAGVQLLLPRLLERHHRGAVAATVLLELAHIRMVGGGAC